MNESQLLELARTRSLREMFEQQKENRRRKEAGLLVDGTKVKVLTDKYRYKRVYLGQIGEVTSYFEKNKYLEAQVPGLGKEGYWVEIINTGIEQFFQPDEIQLVE